MKAGHILILGVTLFLISASSSSMSSAQESTMTTKETLEGPLEIAKALNRAARAQLGFARRLKLR